MADEHEEHRSGGAFIVYKGNTYSKNEIFKELDKYKEPYFRLLYKSACDGKLLFAKAVQHDYDEDRDPHYENDTLVVSGYIQSEMVRANIENGDHCVDDVDRKHALINHMYKNYQAKVFSKLKNIHFCSVIYDSYRNKLIAGVTEPLGKYTELYYGHTRKDNELMFSNVKELLESFCDEIVNMDNNTYIIDDIIYSLDGTKIDTGKMLLRKIPL